MSILTAVGPGLNSEEGLEADQAFQGLTELSADPTRHTQVRGRGVYSYKAGLRGLELGNVGFLKSRPNCLVFQNIFVLETFRGNFQITLNLVYRDAREFQRSGPAVR